MMNAGRAHSYILTPMEPFGVLITPGENRDALDISPTELGNLIQEHKLVLLRGFEDLSRRELLDFGLRFRSGELLHWDFGPVMEMRPSPNAKNYLFSSESVPYHWDGAFHQVPSLLVFNCLEAPEKTCGGETLFADAESLYANATEEEKKQWRRITLCYKTQKAAHYGGQIQVPMVQAHPAKNCQILRYAEPVETELNPVALTIQNSPVEAAQLIESLKERLYSRRYCLEHQWENGDILIADNHSLLHGRRSFSRQTPRHLRRIQVL